MTDLSPVFFDLVRFETRLYNLVNDRMRAEHGLTTGQFMFLRYIGETEKCRVNDLARGFAIAVGATSKAVDRLETAGWVNRRPNPENRRSSLLVLSPAGRKLFAAATPTFEKALETWLSDPLKAAALRQLADALAVLRGALEDADVGRPAG